MTPRSPVRLFNVFDAIFAAESVIARELGIGAGNDIEAIEDVNPPTLHVLFGEPIVARPTGPEILDLVQPDRTANGHQPIDGWTVVDTREAIIGDHGAHAVRDDDESIRRGAQRLQS